LRAAIHGKADLVTSHAGFLHERPSRDDVEKGRVKVHHVSLAAGNTGPGANFFVHHAGKANVLLRTSLAQSLGPCLPELSISASPFVDWGMYTNYILNRATISVVPESMYYYKMNSENSIFYGASNFLKFLGARKIVNKYCEFYKLNVMGCELLWISRQQTMTLDSGGAQVPLTKAIHRSGAVSTVVLKKAVGASAVSRSMASSMSSSATTTRTGGRQRKTVLNAVA